MIEGYLEKIDTRGPDDFDNIVDILGYTIFIKAGVWSPEKGKSTKMFIELFDDYNFTKISTALEIGTGTGILSILLKDKGILDVLATDITDQSILNAEANFKRNAKSIKVIKSDLFEDLDQDKKYDLIIFNCPASHPKRTDIRGKLLHNLWSQDLNLRQRFINQLEKFITKDGRALLMNSSFDDFNPLPLDFRNNSSFNFKTLIASPGEHSLSEILEITLK